MAISSLSFSCVPILQSWTCTPLYIHQHLALDRRAFTANLARHRHSLALVLALLLPCNASMSRASLLDARLPAVHLQRLGWPLVLATIFVFLQQSASTYRFLPDRRTRTPQGHKTPPIGVQSQGTLVHSSHAQSTQQCRRQNSGVKELQ